MGALKFCEMPYERPDGETLKKSIAALTARLTDAQSYDEARSVFLEKETLFKHIQTLSTLAEVRHTIDTRDAFYDEETRFWNQLSPGAGGVCAGVDQGDARHALPRRV